MAIEKVVRDNGSYETGLLLNKGHKCLAYAADVVLMAWTKKELQRLIRRLQGDAKKTGLIIIKTILNTC